MTIISVGRPTREGRADDGDGGGGGRVWTLRALCRDDPQYADGPYGYPIDPTRFARVLAHNCRTHCPVVRQCADALIAQRADPPRRIVRAGVWFPPRGAPSVLPDPGCSPECARRDKAGAR